MSIFLLGLLNASHEYDWTFTCMSWVGGSDPITDVRVQSHTHPSKMMERSADLKGSANVTHSWYTCCPNLLECLYRQALRDPTFLRPSCQGPSGWWLCRILKYLLHLQRGQPWTLLFSDRCRSKSSRRNAGGNTDPPSKFRLKNHCALRLCVSILKRQWSGPSHLHSLTTGLSLLVLKW